MYEVAAKRPADTLAMQKRTVAKQDAVFRAICRRWQCRPGRLPRYTFRTLSGRISRVTGRPQRLNPEQLRQAAKSFAQRHSAGA